MQTKQEIIQKINELDVERFKLIGRLELLDEQEKAAAAVIEVKEKPAE